MDDSILNTIKSMLGGIEDDNTFDTDIIVLINSAFQTLRQLGVGPAKGFTISDSTSTWTDFSTGPEISNVKTYIYLKVKTIFDPPSSSTVMDAYKATISELEWRLNADCEEVTRHVLCSEG